MLRPIIFLCSALILLAAPLYAKDSDYEKSMARGIAAIENNSYSEAAAELSDALLTKPDDSQALLYLGILQSRTSDSNAESTLKASLREDPSNIRTSYELANIYLKKGAFAEAKDYYEDVIAKDSEGDLASSARHLLKMTESKQVDKSWEVKFLTGMQYDDNVVLSADGSGLPAGVSQKDDWRFIINPSLTYSAIKKEKFELKLGYDLYQSLHTKINQFDLNQNRFEIAGIYKLSSKIESSLSYNFEYLHIGGDPYAANHVVSPAITASGSNGFRATVAYRFRETSYKNAPLFLTNSERSGENHSFSITASMPVAEKLKLRSSYQLSIEKAEKKYWDFLENRLSVGTTCRLPADILLDFSAEAAFRGYDSVAPSAAKKREETTWTLSALISKEVIKNLSFVAGYTTMRNESNISDYDYRRGITSVLAQMRF